MKIVSKTSCSKVTFAFIKPDAFERRMEIQNIIKENGFTIVETKQLHLTQSQAMEFYKEHSGRSFYSDLVDYMTSGPVLAMKMEKMNALKEWRALMGPTDPEIARKSHPKSIRALFGNIKSTKGGLMQNAVHGSDSKQAAQREIDLIFNQQ